MLGAKALTVIPNVNLISNIGFGSEAVHTKVKGKFAEMEIEPKRFPISHPSYILRDSKADFLGMVFCGGCKGYERE